MTASDQRWRRTATGEPPRHVVFRVTAVVLALVWWVPMFGLVDLATPFVGPASFSPAYLVDAGWGLLYTVLVGVPTLALAWRPTSPDLALQLLVVAAALAVPAVLALEPGHLVPAAVLAATGLVALRLGQGSARLPAGFLRTPRGRWRVPGALVVLGIVPALVYAWTCLSALRRGVPSDETNALDHWPAQAALALAVVLVAAQAVLARGGRVAAWGAATCAAGLGGFSLLFPGRVGGLSTLAAVLAVAWAAAYVAAWEVARTGSST